MLSPYILHFVSFRVCTRDHMTYGMIGLDNTQNKNYISRFIHGKITAVLNFRIRSCSQFIFMETLNPRVGKGKWHIFKLALHEDIIVKVHLPNNLFILQDIIFSFIHYRKCRTLTAATDIKAEGVISPSVNVSLGELWVNMFLSARLLVWLEHGKNHCVVERIRHCKPSPEGKCKCWLMGNIQFAMCCHKCGKLNSIKKFHNYSPLKCSKQRVDGKLLHAIKQDENLMALQK